MKTLRQIKHDVAVQNGYEDWNEMIFSSIHPNTLDKIQEAISKKYALEVAKEALKNASENAFVGSSYVQGGCMSYDDYYVDKESILNEDNIPET